MHHMSLLDGFDYRTCTLLNLVGKSPVPEREAAENCSFAMQGWKE